LRLIWDKSNDVNPIYARRKDCSIDEIRRLLAAARRQSFSPTMARLAISSAGALNFPATPQ